MSASAYIATAACAESYRFLGRVNPATRELTWPATGIAVSFTGTSASIPITSQWGDVSIEMVVDSGEPVAIDHVSGTSIDTPKLSAGPHTVEIRKKSEANFGSLFLGEPTAPDGGALSPPLEAAPARRIELIGDSITVGYGLEGVFPCTNTADKEGATKTYGALTARNLSADYSIVAWSGKGLTRNYVSATPDTSPLMPALWTRYGANDADGSYDFRTPVDIVVINLGTNDFSFAEGVRPQLDAAAYTAAMVEFATAVHDKYPDAAVFITSSPSLGDDSAEQQKTKQVNALQDAVAQLGFKAHFVNFATQDASNNNIGCDYHPSANTHQQMAVVLTDAIKEALGI
ncbi:SGNH hydrolase-type esterase domain-containing protein [Apiospora phragmitis]|uniref:SGNH hydrolase-type esterase domain-containing protein n=1 Tax=Apiospora phragmitis TaxID=2905665 RepID=A0ABR1WSW3_9PEZI